MNYLHRRNIVNVSEITCNHLHILHVIKITKLKCCNLQGSYIYQKEFNNSLICQKHTNAEA